VALVADELQAAGSAGTAEQIRSTIGSVTSVTPEEADIARVSARLAAAGWPLAPITMADERQGRPRRFGVERNVTLPRAPGCSLQGGAVGRGGVEPPTSRFSGARSYRLSYLPG